MTLILSVITPEYVLQVGDRRLTYLNGQIATDKTIKTVLFNCKISFSYTGLAQLPRAKKVQKIRKEKDEVIDTNLWIAECLSVAKSMNDCLDIIKEEADAIFLKEPYCRYTHAFIGVGYIKHNNGPVEPAIFEISKFPAEKEFKYIVKLIKPTKSKNAYLFHYSLSDLPQYIIQKYNKRVKNASKKSENAPIVASILRDMILDVSKTTTKVGDGILQTCMPRSQVELALKENRYLLSAQRPSNDYISFRHFSSKNESDDGNQHGPTIVHGMSIITEIVLGKDNVINLKFE